MKLIRPYKLLAVIAAMAIAAPVSNGKHPALTVGGPGRAFGCGLGTSCAAGADAVRLAARGWNCAQWQRARFHVRSVFIGRPGVRNAARRANRR